MTIWGHGRLRQDHWEAGAADDGRARGREAGRGYIAFELLPGERSAGELGMAQRVAEEAKGSCRGVFTTKMGRGGR